MKRFLCARAEGFIAARNLIATVVLVAVFACVANAQTQIVTAGGGSGGASGTVESVAATVPAFMAVTGSPVTTTGTLAFSFATQAQNLIFAAPCSSTGAVTFRVLCSGDIPNNGANTSGTAAGLSGTNLTGDVSNSGNTVTLATVNSNVGSFTAANITVDAKGRVTAAANGSAGDAPAGSGSELQFRSSGSALGAVTGSSVSGAVVTLGDTLKLPASFGKGIAFGAEGTAISWREAAVWSLQANGGEVARVSGPELNVLAALRLQAGSGASSYFDDGGAPENLLLSTSGTTTDSVNVIVPANSIIRAIVWRVTAAIADATDFKVQILGGNDWVTIGTATSAQTALTLGSSGILVPSAFADQYNDSTARKLRVTTTGTPSAGRIRLIVIAETIAAPSS